MPKCEYIEARRKTGCNEEAEPGKRFCHAHRLQGPKEESKGSRTKSCLIIIVVALAGLITLCTIVGVVATLEDSPAGNQGGMDARINLNPGSIEIINENNFRWYGLKTTLYTNDGTYSDRHLFGNDNWPWLRPDRIREPDEEYSPSLHPDSTPFLTEAGEPYSGNNVDLERGTWNYTIRSVTLEAKSQVDGPYDLTFSIDMEDALATPWPERKPLILIHPVPNPPPGGGYTTIYLKHHEPKYDEVMAIATPYPLGLGDTYNVPLEEYRKIEVLLGTATAPAPGESDQAIPTPVSTPEPTETPSLAPTPVPSPTLPRATPTSTPKASPGLGVSRHELEAVFSQPEWSFSFWHVAGGAEHEPRSVGEIEGTDTLSLLLIGPPGDLSQVRTVVDLAAPLDIGLYLVELLSSVLPTWTDSDEWLADATNSLVAGADKLETTHRGADVSLELHNRDSLPMLDLTITAHGRP